MATLSSSLSADSISDRFPHRHHSLSLQPHSPPSSSPSPSPSVPHPLNDMGIHKTSNFNLKSSPPSSFSNNTSTSLAPSDSHSNHNTSTTTNDLTTNSSKTFSSADPSSYLTNGTSTSISTSDHSVSSPLPHSSSSLPSNTGSTVKDRDLPLFRNQVGGHSALLQLHSGTIYKPLIAQEYEFYSNLERELPHLMPFVPKYYGVMDLERLTEEMASTTSQNHHHTTSISTTSTTASTRMRDPAAPTESSPAFSPSSAPPSSHTRRRSTSKDDATFDTFEQIRELDETMESDVTMDQIDNKYTPRSTAHSTSQSHSHSHSRTQSTHSTPPLSPSGGHSPDVPSSALSLTADNSMDSSNRISSNIFPIPSPPPPSLSIPALSSPSSTQSMPEKGYNNKLFNKWSMKCQLRKQKPASTSPNSSSNAVAPLSRSQIHYIVLEDLTYAYDKPNILDLKIGTRQHSDNECASKIASKTARCKATTSHSLGLRLCGMQVYHPAKGSYVYRDKYYGRALTEQTFILALREYFHDGEKLLVDIIQAFVVRLEKFRKAIQREQRYRFYSSSLLLVYEGDATRMTPTLQHRMPQPSPASSPMATPQTGIVNAKNVGLGEFSGLSSSSSSAPAVESSTAPTSRQQSSNNSPVARGSANCAEQSSSDSTNNAVSSVPVSILPLSGSTPSSSSNSSSMNLSSSASSSSVLSSSCPPDDPGALLPPVKLFTRKRKTTRSQARERRQREKGGIDVRIIDFAHTYKVQQGGAIHATPGVDQGLLLGFNHLIQACKQLITEEINSTEIAINDPMVVNQGKNSTLTTSSLPSSSTSSISPFSSS